MQESTLVQQAKPVAQSLGFVQAVRADNHSLALLSQMTDVVENDLSTDHVQPSRWLVEQNNRRIVGSARVPA